MEHGDDQIGVQSLCRLDRVGKCLAVDRGILAVIVGVEQIDRVFGALGELEAVDALGVGDERDFDAVDVFQQHALICGLFLRRGIGADMVDAEGVEIFDGAVQTGNAVCDAVGIGGLDKVKADVCQRLPQRLGRAEFGAALIRLAAERQLKIAVVASVRLLCKLDLVVIGHDIAHCRERDDGVRLNLDIRRGGRVGVGRGIDRLGRIVRVCTFTGAAAHGQHDGQHQNQRQNGQNDALLKLTAALLRKALHTARLLLARERLLFVGQGRLFGRGRRNGRLRCGRLLGLSLRMLLLIHKKPPFVDAVKFR